MIGQVDLLKRVQQLIDNEQFPRTSIIVGPKKSGKKTLCTEIASKLGAQLIEVGTKVDDVREIITVAYQQTEPTIYLIPHVEDMSNAAKNALLKIIEEPPKKAYFILTAYDASMITGTIKSRSYLFYIQHYTSKDLINYAKEHYDIEDLELEMAGEFCSTPGEIDMIIEYGIKEFIDYVSRVVNSIGEVTPANALKISTMLNLKDDPSKWDISLFMQVFMIVCFKKCEELCDLRYSAMICNTVNYKSQLSINGIMKQALVDEWLLSLQDIWE